MGVNVGVQLVEPTLVTASAVAVYTCPATLVRVIISQARVTNYSTGPVDFTVHVDTASAGAIDQYLVLDGLSIAAGETVLVAELIGQGLVPGDIIYVTASAATALTFSCCGMEITS